MLELNTKINTDYMISSS